MSTATVRLDGPGGARTAAAIGTGPVDAAFRAIDQLVNVKAVLIEYDVHSVTAGIDALGEVTVRVRDDGPDEARVFGGYGADTDIITASAQAYLAALNRLLVARENAEAAGGIRTTGGTTHNLGEVGATGEIPESLEGAETTGMGGLREAGFGATAAGHGPQQEREA
jgi:hypothetical protein